VLGWERANSPTACSSASRAAWPTEEASSAPGQPRLGLGRQLQAGRLVAEQLRLGPAEGPAEQLAVEGAGLLVVVDPRLTMASRLSVPGRVSPLPAAWLRPPQQPSRGTGTP
jgi:hypothetical protein